MANDQGKLYSRQGYEVNAKRLGISEEEFDKFISDLQDQYDHVFEQLGAEEILFDGELLPWNAMGKDLIERDFLSISKSLETELTLLKENGFDESLSNLLNRVNGLETIDVTTVKPHQLKEKENVLKIVPEIQSVELMENDLNKYIHQLNIFSKDAELEFRAFSILKYKKKSGEEENVLSSSNSNIEISHSLNLPLYFVIDLTDFSIQEEQKGTLFILDKSEIIYSKHNVTIYDFWNMITKGKEMEGVVIKPEQIYIPGVAPYLKCRNKEYLRITYGPDYDSLNVKKSKLLRNKSIKRKIETSIKEWELGRKLLDISQSDISIDNNKWVGLITQLMSEQENEKDLDPRL